MIKKHHQIQNKTIKLFFFFLFIASHAFAQESDLSKLKGFRNYFIIDKIVKPAHHFDIWFHRGNARATLAGNTESDIINLDEKEVREVEGLIDPQPNPLRPVPPKLKHLQSAVIKWMNTHYPSAESIQIHYSGFFSTVDITELSPLSIQTDPFKRKSMTSEGRYRIAEDSMLLIPYGTSDFYENASAGIRKLCSDWEKSKCFDHPHFIDYTLPEAVQGKSLLYTASRESLPSRNWKDFSAKVISTINSIHSGNYVNPLGKILASQGNEQIPEHLNQVLTHKIEVYGRVPHDFEKQFHKTLLKKFSVKQAYDKTLSWKDDLPALGITISFSLSLKTMTAFLTVEHKSGSLITRNYQIKADLVSELSKVNGEVKIVSAGNISMESNFDSWEPEPIINMPGYGDYNESSVDVSGLMEVEFVM